MKKPVVVIITCAVLAQITIVAVLAHEKNEWREVAESCGKSTIRDAINQFTWRTITTGRDNVRIGTISPGETFSVSTDLNGRKHVHGTASDIVADAMGAAHISVVRIELDGFPNCIGPHACDAVTAENTCDAIVAVQRRYHPDVDVRCTDARVKDIKDVE